MLTTLEKDLIKTCFLTALITSLSNLLVVFSFTWLRLQYVLAFWPSVWGTVLVVLLLAGMIYFYAGRQAARLTGKADTGVAIGGLAGLISGLTTTTVLMGLYVVFFIIIPEYGSSGASDMGRDIAWQFFYLLLVICGVFFIYLQGLFCGSLAGGIGGELGEWWADESRSEVCIPSSRE